MKITLKEFKLIANNVLNEEQVPNESVGDIVLKRIPFLKDYNIFRNSKPKPEHHWKAQRVIFNEDVKKIIGGEIYNFEQYNVSSEVTYTLYPVNNLIIHYFIIDNSFHMMQPKNMDDLTYRVFRLASNQLEKKLSYHKEIRLKQNEEIDKKELDEIINDMNGVLFEFEEFTSKHNIDLF